MWMREKDWVVLHLELRVLRIEASETSVGPVLLFSVKRWLGYRQA